MNKYRIYIDEVGNNDLNSSVNPNHRYLSLTGLIFELNYVKEIVNPSLENLKQKYFPYHPDEPVILHRKELVNKKFPFGALKDPKIEDEFNSQLLKLLTDLKYVVVSVLVDKMEHKTKYQTWKYDPYHYCMEIIIERFFFFLESVDSVGDVMIESRGGKEDIRLKKSYSRIYQTGTQFIETERLKKRLTSCELKVKPKMLNIACLQLTDLVAHPSRRFMFRKYGINVGIEFAFGDKIIDVIEKKYYRGKNGIEGYGIKLLP
ncbi:MAG: DUF3800 domain-containing protein [Ignavibacteria bacterium]|nr:DUF3800 domain-containing protein [Ignavibacteria bacterium]